MTKKCLKNLSRTVSDPRLPLLEQRPAGYISIVRCVIDVTNSLRALRRILDYVAVTWGNVVVSGIYALPRIPTDMFKVFFDRVGGCVASFFPFLILISRDFNANYSLRGSSRM